jgi:hypothetical protein
MFDVRYAYETLKVTNTLEEAVAIAREKKDLVEIYDFRSNRLLYEWSPITGLKQFLVD